MDATDARHRTSFLQRVVFARVPNQVTTEQNVHAALSALRRAVSLAEQFYYARFTVPGP